MPGTGVHEDPTWSAKFGAIVRHHRRTTTEMITLDAIANCPIGISTEGHLAGELSSTIHTEPGTKADYVVIGTQYWDTVEYGSPEHDITPTWKRALWWPGAEHPVSRVHHPGTPEQAPMRRALRRARALRALS